MPQFSENRNCLSEFLLIRSLLMKERYMKILVVTILIIFAGCEWLETYENKYENYDAALKANALGAGKWLPTFLPRSATNILERYKVDTNESWVRFSFDVDHLNSMVANCKIASSSTIKFPRRTAGHWWPKHLLKNQSDAMSANEKGIYYYCNSVSFLAIINETKIAYYWTIYN